MRELPSSRRLYTRTGCRESENFLTRLRPVLHELVDALEAVLRDTLGKGYRHDLEDNRPLSQLSARQITVLKLVASGLSNAQIAEERGTTVRAVEGIVSRVFGALNIDPQAEGNARVEAAKVFFSSTGHIIAN